VSVSWSVALFGLAWLGWRKGLFAAGLHYLRASWRRPDRFDVAVALALGFILVLLLLVALISPPNNNDSLQYHMSRVMHWAQNQSLRHYPTAFEPQLFNPIFAELGILNLRLLWGNDRLANLVQWSCLLGVLAGATALAKLLGAGRNAQWITVAYAVSVPMGLLQATSTQNDMVTAFWFISLLYFVALSSKRDLHLEELLGLAFSLGLGLATKGPFYPMCVLPMLYFIVLQFRNSKLGLVIGRGVSIVAVVLAVNLGYWGRNVLTYGGPLGSSSWVEAMTNSDLSLGSVAGSLVRDILLNFSTPEDGLNARLVGTVKSVFRSVDPRAESFELMWGWNHEDLAGSPVHLLLALAAMMVLIFFRKRIDWARIGPLILILAGSFVVFAAVVPSRVFDVRYQLPFFVAGGIFFALAVQALDWRILTAMAVPLLLVAALPWVLFNRTKPLIAMRDSTDPFTIPCLAGCTTGSILNEPQSSIIFGVWSQLREPYRQAVSDLRASGCRSIGFKLDSHDLEYLFWWLLDAPQNGTRIENIDTYPRLERYVDPSFKPCAILCTICGNQTQLHGLDLARDYNGTIQLYFGNEYDPNP